jgi:hypothetical protein
MSVFLISRPPDNLDDAVRFCNEYLTAGGKTRGARSQVSSLASDKEKERKEKEPSTRGAAVVKKEPAVEQKDLVAMMKLFQTAMADCAKQVVATCTEMVKQEMAKMAPKPVEAQRMPGETRERRHLPPAPCYNCGDRWHWYRDCPHPKPPARKKWTVGEKTKASPHSGNAEGPQQ